jgi:hypothetical protein
MSTRYSSAGCPHLIVTTINPPNRIMRALAQGAISKGWRFGVIGDAKTPDDFRLDGAVFVGIGAQLDMNLRFAEKCPLGHYSRKNIGYLLAIQNAARFIVETDDDNIPLPGFFAERERYLRVPSLRGHGWVNVYRYFYDELIWPRGLPLDSIQDSAPVFDELSTGRIDCPIQQGLADSNPDVDAVYRLTRPLPVRFRRDRRIALGSGSLCPFNSQNTTWWPDAYPLLYLPSYCSFRMADIWRSFVAQRIAWEFNWHILFHEATVEQERNAHDLLQDFADEIPGYLNNRRIANELVNLRLKPSLQAIPDNLLICYEALVVLGVLGIEELDLLQTWLHDLRSIY